ncbi:hypothetical protein [Hydrangea phyllody phytoplasma]|uniref:hypothetical protein n=1 Tax=Hydrangea phyllody phytoplasma TaxID=238673 RepID=UPI002D2014CB|nr:hypothetical protein HP2P_4300 [Hydrangea phyllody phytoplasma]GLH62136.1 hypothetical protein HP2P_5430 [Hydrangea phyllody phytoplasma]
MLLIINFNFVLSINAHSSFFHNQNETKIKLADYQTLQQEWLATQPKMKRYDIPVLSKESIPEILKYFNIEIDNRDLLKPTYNPYANTYFWWFLKDPPEGLMGVYFKPRSNPFNIKYPSFDNKYTLEDLLKYEIAIEEAFVFWDAQQKTQEEKCNVQLININLFVDQSKEEAINNYLIQQKIIQKPKLIKLGFYNPTPNTGLVVPFPLGGFLSFEFEAIYFDDGIRLLPQLTYTIEDLLKLSNGAKNVYLFTFSTQKRIKSIELPDAIDPYQAIRTWKRDNNLFDYEGEFIRQTDSMKVVLSAFTNRKETISCELLQLKNIFETEKEKFIISCKDEKVKLRIFNNYSSEYINWLRQCYIKPGSYYTGDEVRDKFGRFLPNHL